MDLNDWDMAFGTLATPEAPLPDPYDFSPAELERPSAIERHIVRGSTATVCNVLL